MKNPEIHPAALPLELLMRNCESRHERRRGPGGQHRNKTESAVVIRHLPTGVEGQAAERRSQVDNHRNAVKRLRVNLALAVRVEPVEGAGPSELWRSRCHEGRIGINEDHDDFATMLAEALDLLAARHGQVPSAAQHFGCTPTQLLKMLKKEPRAFQWLNELRHRRHLPPLE